MQMKSLRRISLFFCLSESLSAYLKWIYITSCIPSKMLSKQCRCSCFSICFIIKEVTYITFELKADRARKCFFVAALLLCKLYNLFGIFEHRQ